ncbi:MAG TPA: histidine kinase [Candidatus Dormibacteraeota bacterium]|jgi:signal transduction histidine kinase
MADEDIEHLVARELHDRVAQTLTSMLIDLENFKAEQVGREGVLRQMNTIQESTRGVLTSLRELLYELRGIPSVDDRFLDALAVLVARFQEKTQIDATLSILPGWPARVTAPASRNLYRIIEEALVNVRQHSGAKTVAITLQPDSDSELSVCISDDGRGLDLEATGPIGMGLLGVNERAVFLGARLRIETISGVGTTLRVTIPRAHLEQDFAQPASYGES